MSEDKKTGIHGFCNLPNHQTAKHNSVPISTRQNSSGESKSWLDWFTSLFGPHATGVRNWLLIAAIALLIILSLNPVTLSATAFLSLLGIFGAIGGFALLGALANGIRAFIAGYKEYSTQNGGRVLPPSKLGYLRHLARQFAQWVVEHPFQMAVIVLTLLAPVFAIPSLIGASTLAILYTVGNALGWAVVNDGICRLGNYIWEQCAAFAANARSGGSSDGTSEDENNSNRVTETLPNQNNNLIPTSSPVVTQSPSSLAGTTRITPAQSLIQALSAANITYQKVNGTVCFFTHEIDDIYMCEHPDGYKFVILKQTKNFNQNQILILTNSINTVKISFQNQDSQTSYTQTLRGKAIPCTIFPRRESPEIVFDFNNKIPSYEIKRETNMQRYEIS